jgi:ketosteroid isomerase-like protein
MMLVLQRLKGTTMSSDFPLPTRSPGDVVRSLHRATAAHDLDGIVAHFAPDYELENPCRPDRSFKGHDQVRRNWAHILAEVTDLVFEERGLVEQGSRVWTEIAMRGHRPDGSEHDLRGVMIFRVEEGIIHAGTFYLAPVVRDGLDADAAVRANVSGAGS